MDEIVLKQKFNEASGTQTILSFKHFTELLDVLYSRTIDWGKRNGIISDSNLSPSAEKITAILNNYMQKTDSSSLLALAECFSIILNEEIRITTKKLVVSSYLVLIAVNNPNSHNYGINEPFLTTGGGNGYRKNLGPGNNYPANSSSLGLASKEQIIDLCLNLLKTHPSVLDWACVALKIKSSEVAE